MLFSSPNDTTTSWKCLFFESIVFVHTFPTGECEIHMAEWRLLWFPVSWVRTTLSSAWFVLWGGTNEKQKENINDQGHIPRTCYGPKCCEVGGLNSLRLCLALGIFTCRELLTPQILCTVSSTARRDQAEIRNLIQTLKYKANKQTKEGKLLLYFHICCLCVQFCTVLPSMTYI